VLLKFARQKYNTKTSLNGRQRKDPLYLPEPPRSIARSGGRTGERANVKSAAREKEARAYVSNGSSFLIDPWLEFGNDSAYEGNALKKTKERTCNFKCRYPRVGRLFRWGWKFTKDWYCCVPQDAAGPGKLVARKGN
jgi:hypothetical protein